MRVIDGVGSCETVDLKCLNSEGIWYILAVDDLLHLVNFLWCCSQVLVAIIRYQYVIYTNSHQQGELF